MNNYWFSLFLLGTYFLSAIPFALLVSRLMGVDLRAVGSGNLGATNVYRGCGLMAAILVFVLDALKGAVPTFLIQDMVTQPWMHVSVAAVAIIGHSFTCFAGFKGGKGAATGIGVLIALSPLIGVSLLAVAIVLIMVTRYVAPVSILCALLAPILFYLFGYPLVYVLFLVGIALFIVSRHSANIKRLLEGRENKI